MTAASANFAPYFSPMPFHAPPSVQRRLLIVAAVLGFHVAGLWALQSGLLHRAVAKVVPVLVMADLIEAPQPEISPLPPAPPIEKARPASPAPKRSQPAPAPAPQPLAIANPTPAPNAPTGTTEPDPEAPALLDAVSEPAPAPAPAPAPQASVAPPAPPRVDLPSSSADYLNNPRPPYPPLSRRLGEQGRVVVRVFIEANGTASKAEVRSSSGYDRLDQTALQTVLKWRYAPGKRNGVAEAMWFNVPINFVLE